MKKNMFKVMALSLAMATLSTTAAFAAGWGKVGSEWYYYQEGRNRGKKYLDQHSGQQR